MRHREPTEHRAHSYRCALSVRLTMQRDSLQSDGEFRSLCVGEEDILVAGARVPQTPHDRVASRGERQHQAPSGHKQNTRNEEGA